MVGGEEKIHIATLDRLLDKKQRLENRKRRLFDEIELTDMLIDIERGRIEEGFYKSGK